MNPSNLKRTAMAWAESQGGEGSTKRFTGTKSPHVNSLILSAFSDGGVESVRSLDYKGLSQIIQSEATKKPEIKIEATPEREMLAVRAQNRHSRDAGKKREVVRKPPPDEITPDTPLEALCRRVEALERTNSNLYELIAVLNDSQDILRKELSISNRLNAALRGIINEMKGRVNV